MNAFALPCWHFETAHVYCSHAPGTYVTEVVVRTQAEVSPVQRMAVETKSRRIGALRNGDLYVRCGDAHLSQKRRHRPTDTL